MTRSTAFTADGVVGSAVTEAGGGRWADLAWLTWRQHRGLLIASIVLTIACGVILLATTFTLNGYQACPTANDTCSMLHGGVINLAHLQIELLALLPAFIVVFWGAPLVANEYEQRTQSLAWGQDVSPARWLLRKACLLAAAAIILAILVGLCAQPLTRTLQRVEPASGFDREYFEAGEPMIVAYTLLALAIGIVAGTLLRRTLPAMAVGVVSFAAIRLGLALFARPHYLPPSHVTAPLASKGPIVDRNALLLINNQPGTASGSIRSVPGACSRVGATDHFYVCQRAHGITRRVSVFQPADRLHWFQLIEAGICVVIAAALLALALRQVQRHRAG